MRSVWKHKFVHLSLFKRQNHERIYIRNRSSVFRVDLLEKLLIKKLSIYTGAAYCLVFLDNLVKDLKLGEIVFTKKRTRRIHGELIKGKTKRNKKKREIFKKHGKRGFFGYRIKEVE